MNSPTKIYLFFFLSPQRPSHPQLHSRDRPAGSSPPPRAAWSEGFTDFSKSFSPARARGRAVGWLEARAKVPARIRPPPPLAYLEY